MFKQMRYSPVSLFLSQFIPPLPAETYVYRQVLSISSKTDILEHIYSLPTEQQQLEGMAAIREIESAAMGLQEPQPGLEDLMGYLEMRGLRKALCTRNFESAIFPFPLFFHTHPIHYFWISRGFLPLRLTYFKLREIPF